MVFDRVGWGGKGAFDPVGVSQSKLAFAECLLNDFRLFLNVAANF